MSRWAASFRKCANVSRLPAAASWKQGGPCAESFHLLQNTSCPWQCCWKSLYQAPTRSLSLCKSPWPFRQTRWGDLFVSAFDSVPRCPGTVVEQSQLPENVAHSAGLNGSGCHLKERTDQKKREETSQISSQPLHHARTMLLHDASFQAFTSFCSSSCFLKHSMTPSWINTPDIASHGQLSKAKEVGLDEEHALTILTWKSGNDSCEVTRQNPSWPSWISFSPGSTTFSWTTGYQSL